MATKITEYLSRQVGLHIVDANGLRYNVLEMQFSTSGTDFYTQSELKDHEGNYWLAEFSTRFREPGIIRNKTGEAVHVFTGFTEVADREKAEDAKCRLESDLVEVRKLKEQRTAK